MLSEYTVMYCDVLLESTTHTRSTVQTDSACCYAISLCATQRHLCHAHEYRDIHLLFSKLTLFRSVFRALNIFSPLKKALNSVSVQVFYYYYFISTVLIGRAIHNSMCSNTLIYNNKRYTQLCMYIIIKTV